MVDQQPHTASLTSRCTTVRGSSKSSAIGEAESRNLMRPHHKLATFMYGALLQLCLYYQRLAEMYRFVRTVFRLASIPPYSGARPSTQSH